MSLRCSRAKAGTEVHSFTAALYFMECLYVYFIPTSFGVHLWFCFGSSKQCFQALPKPPMLFYSPRSFRNEKHVWGYTRKSFPQRPKTDRKAVSTRQVWLRVFPLRSDRLPTWRFQSSLASVFLLMNLRLAPQMNRWTLDSPGIALHLGGDCSQNTSVGKAGTMPDLFTKVSSAPNSIPSTLSVLGRRKQSWKRNS